jgi:hypothetical protein
MSKKRANKNHQLSNRAFLLGDANHTALITQLKKSGTSFHLIISKEWRLAWSSD